MAFSPTDLTAMDRQERIRALRQQAFNATSHSQVSALLVTDPISLRYLTGFTGSAGQLLLDTDRALFLTDGRYRTQLASELEVAQVAKLVDTHIGSPVSQRQTLIDWLAESKPVNAECVLGVEADHLTWAEVIALQDALSTRIEPTDGLVAQQRARKDAGEVERIKAAATIADQALAKLLPQLAQQPTELEFARELDALMLSCGAEAVSFETICASGPNSALPHARPTSRRIQKGDLVVLDFGAQVDGYHSDMTRTFCIGTPNATQRDILNAVKAAQQAGVKAVQAGVRCNEIDRACRSVLEAAQMGEEFVHGTGHGVGLQIHEAPWLGSSVETPLQVGNVVTVEPGVYRPGVGGARVEDTVLVTAEAAQRLTTAPKDWEV